jgi:DNA modification methylase
MDAARTVAAVWPEQAISLQDVEHADQRLYQYWAAKFVLQPSLTRSLVSFQANKDRAAYRWYKFKEAFSAELVEYLLQKYRVTTGRILDPFAGSGTALFAASQMGLDAEGIELLPIGQQIIATRQCLEHTFTAEDFAILRRWREVHPWEHTDAHVPLPTLRITRGAYPEETVEAIERYLGALQKENDRVQLVLRFALLCVLEAISYTRKDGQYLRWDYRSGRRQGKKRFDKGVLPTFAQAITEKLEEILADLQPPHVQGQLFPLQKTRGEIILHAGSCLKVLPTLPDDVYQAIVTSPPYCNRYDYTRTYALELAVLGIGEQELVDLRQEMLSCTVENRPKDLLLLNPRWTKALAAADNQELLQTILGYLEQQKALELLNNNGIPRMVRGYFYEMACVIAECARVLQPGAPLFMVNDNVRYAGASISVDMILSSLAEQLGMEVEQILVLPNGKGNSSQQMGVHGREPLRKCVYVWRKPR